MSSLPLYRSSLPRFMQGRNEGLWRPGQETNWRPLFSVYIFQRSTNAVPSYAPDDADHMTTHSRH